MSTITISTTDYIKDLMAVVEMALRYSRSYSEDNFTPDAIEYFTKKHILDNLQIPDENLGRMKYVLLEEVSDI